MKQVATEKTVITLSLDGSLPLVERWVNGFCVQEKKVRTDDLIFSLMKMLETDQLLQIISNDAVTLEELLEPFLRNTKDPKSLDRVFRILLNRVDNENDLRIHTKLLLSMAKRFNFEELSPGFLDKLFKHALYHVEQLNEQQAFYELFLRLFEKVDIVSAEFGLVSKVLETVVEKVELENDQKVLRDLFRKLAEKVEDAWRREILAPYLSKQAVVKSPLLPKNCILYQEQLCGTKIIVIEVEKQRFDVTYHKTTYKNVGHPKMIFCFYVKRGYILEVRLMAVKDTIIKPTSKLYYYPFSNVWRNDFRCCWPGIGQVQLSGLHQLTTIPYLFLSSPSNDHLYSGTNLRDFYASLSEKDFDDSLLEETGLTFSDFFAMEDRSVENRSEPDEN